MFTGDSLTDGNRYKKKEQRWDLNHQMGHTYAYIVNGLLGCRYPERQFRFFSRGVSGNRIVDLYARSETDLFPLKPDVLSVLVGINDGPGDRNNFVPTPGEKYEHLYRLMLQEVKERLPECRMVLMEPFVCRTGSVMENYPVWKAHTESCGQAVRRLAEEFDAVFVPLQEKFDEVCRNYPVEYWCWDGVHPTENGHGMMALEWIRYAGPLLGIS